MSEMLGTAAGELAILRKVRLEHGTAVGLVSDQRLWRFAPAAGRAYLSPLWWRVSTAHQVLRKVRTEHDLMYLADNIPAIRL